MNSVSVLDSCVVNEITAGAFRFREVTYPEDYEMPKHRHSTSHMFLCLAGTIEHKSSCSTHYFSKATLGYVPVNEAHSDRFFTGVRTFDIVLGAEHGELSEGSKGRAFARNDRPSRLAMSAYREFKQCDSMTPLMLESVALEMLVVLHRDRTSVSDTRAPRWLTTVSDLLNDRYSESLSLDYIASEVGVHPAHLTRAFRKQFGYSIGEFVRRIRVERASQMLESSDLSIGEIGLIVGFADQSHFTHTFSRYTSNTPSAYRSHRQQCRSGTNDCSVHTRF